VPANGFNVFASLQQLPNLAENSAHHQRQDPLQAETQTVHPELTSNFLKFNPPATSQNKQTPNKCKNTGRNRAVKTNI